MGFAHTSFIFVAAGTALALSFFLGVPETKAPRNYRGQLRFFQRDESTSCFFTFCDNLMFLENLMFSYEPCQAGVRESASAGRPWPCPSFFRCRYKKTSNNLPQSVTGNLMFPYKDT